MAKKSAWFHNPVSIAVLIATLLSISTWIVNTIMADARQAARIEKTEEKVAELDETVDEHDKEIDDAEKNQELISKDLDYLKESMKEQKTMQQQILEAVKKK